jgi:hypothetical protein
MSRPVHVQADRCTYKPLYADGAPAVLLYLYYYLHFLVVSLPTLAEGVDMVDPLGLEFLHVHAIFDGVLSCKCRRYRRHLNRYVFDILVRV